MTAPALDADEHIGRRVAQILELSPRPDDAGRERLLAAVDRAWPNRRMVSAHRVLPLLVARQGNHLHTMAKTAHADLSRLAQGLTVLPCQVSWWVAGRDAPDPPGPRLDHSWAGWVRLDPPDVDRLLRTPHAWTRQYWPWETGRVLCQVDALTLQLTPRTKGHRR